MSHVATIDVHITDLEALRQAAEMIGLEFRQGQQTYNWWGESMGDYPLPDGFSKEDLGKCEHAIGIPGQHEKGYRKPYEVGVVTRRDGKPGYTLLWDFWDGGNGLEGFVGKDALKLVNAYKECVAVKTMKAAGFSVDRVLHENGAVELRFTETTAKPVFAGAVVGKTW